MQNNLTKVVGCNDGNDDDDSGGGGGNNGDDNCDGDD